MSAPDVQASLDFSGAVYERERDHARLTGQILRIRDLMADQVYRTVEEIADATGDPPTSVSAQLRNLRKIAFGLYEVPKRRRGGDSNLWEYQLGERRA